MSIPRSISVPVLKVIILGSNNVGKTSILSQFVNRRVPTGYRATIGVDMLSKEILLDNGDAISLQLWDTAGQERFRSLGSSYFRGADVCLLVFDITSHFSFERLDSLYEEFLVNANISNPNTVIVALIGNKSDLTRERVVSREMALEWSSSRRLKPIPYFEITARDATMVDEVFIRSVKDSQFWRNQRTSSDQRGASTSSKVASLEKKRKSRRNCCS